MTIKISVDVSGGDHGITVTIPAGIKSLVAFKDLYIYFTGDKINIQKELDKHSNSKDLADRFTIIQADELITTNESISTALRKKKNSSMRVAIDLVKDKKVAACVSAGNTGALIAISRFVLKTVKGIERPVIMGRLPTISGYTHMLDLGANVNSTPKALLEFATMGSIAVKYTKNIKSPTVGLINVGEEENKGNERVQQTSELLKQSDINYIGFIEGHDIYKGKVDLVVCDGFEGNIALKASEGVALMMTHYLKQAFNKNILTKAMYLMTSTILKDFKSNFDPRKYNGASLLGLKGIVIKSHGNADVFSFFQAIKEAYQEIQAGIMQEIFLKIESENSQ